MHQNSVFSTPKPDIVISGQKLQVSEFEFDLGVWINSNLSFGSHIKNMPNN